MFSSHCATIPAKSTSATSRGLTDTEQDSLELLDTKSLLCPDYLNTGTRLHSASKTFPEFQWAGSNSCLIRGGGMQRKGGTVKKQPWGKVWIYLDTHNSLALICFADTETPSRWEKVIKDGTLPTSIQTPDQLRPEC